MRFTRLCKPAADMKKYCTEIRAIDPKTGELKTWAGPNVPGVSFATARQYCRKNGLGYCKVTGELVAHISEDGNVTDYEAPELN